ncbi:hypothetical protein [Streptomyces rubrogriseus]|uniref:hypothetical protein n=1 Tax=Streptomyces rubrogriseus TaxID=194673 RepID=UPI000D59F08B|nr:hypothetical protein [Streptomyces rubrogriseus]
MARLQILELPEGSGDDRPPFVLVVDQVPANGDGFEALRRDLMDDYLAARTGARAVLVFEDTIDIPANDTSAYLREAEATWTPVDEMEVLRQQARHSEEAEAIRKRVSKEQKAALTDALGMDGIRDWDDILNAARGLRTQRDAQAEAIERVRNLHRPVEHRGQTICWECSDYDFPGQTTDSPPVAHDQCATLRALNGPSKWCCGPASDTNGITHLAECRGRRDA